MIKSFFKFLNRFGIWKGFLLWIKFRLGKVENIKLPNLSFPLSLRQNTTDIPTFYQVFLDNGYNLKINSNPKIIIDGGANVGLFAIKIKNDFPLAKVICIEPDLENFQQLNKNLAPYNDIYFENSGIWSKNTKLKVYDKYNYGKWGIVVEEDEKNGNIESISIDSLIKKYAIEKIDILKLDVESSEKHIFSENYKDWLPKVKMLIIELHDWIEEGCSKPFFLAINECFKNYTFSIVSESIIIINEDIPN